MGHEISASDHQPDPSGRETDASKRGYITVSHFRDRSYQGITNVGHKPTVGGEKFIGVETYLFDCNEDLYGEYCKVDFKKFLRPEQKFSSLEALKAQLERDAVKGQEYFETFVKRDLHARINVLY